MNLTITKAFLDKVGTDMHTDDPVAKLFTYFESLDLLNGENAQMTCKENNWYLQDYIERDNFTKAKSVDAKQPKCQLDRQMRL